ncbi:hypothetical protein PBOI14_31700 [Pseudomonas sp. Boi14]|nr:hypothetical protein PBOI14_31700 [Pseudomonas sp. Boi14]
MFRVIKASSLLLATSIVSGCISQPAAIVSAPLQPAANEPTTYLVGAIGPQYLGGGGAATNLRLLIRKRGSINGAAALWEGDPRPTPEDIHEPRAAGSVFVMPLKPGDYEFYNFQFWSMVYTPGLAHACNPRKRAKSSYCRCAWRRARRITSASFAQSAAK